MVGAVGTNTARGSGERTGSGDGDAAHVTENGTQDEEWNGFEDEGSDQQNLAPNRKEGNLGKVKLEKKRKGSKEKKQKPPNRDKATSTAANSFATLEDTADDEVNGKSCIHDVRGEETKMICSIRLAVS